MDRSHHQQTYIINKQVKGLVWQPDNDPRLKGTRRRGQAGHTQGSVWQHTEPT